MKTPTRLSNGAADVNNDLAAHLRESHNINARPRLIGDWNLNLYSNPTAANTPSEEDEGFDPDVFPIESIYKSFRPNKGTVKALVNQSVLSNNYSTTVEPHFYLGSADDTYKYWLSPFTTNSSGVFPNHTDSKTSCRPQVTYGEVLRPNKIVIKFENTWASPKDYRIMIQTTVGGAWSTIASDIAPDKNGVVAVYFDNTSTWKTTAPATLMRANVAGIKLEVDTLGAGKDRNNVTTTYVKKNWSTGVSQRLSTNGGNSNLALIAIEPHLETDITPYLINVGDNFDMAEDNELYPIGTTISATADLSFSNESNIFNNDNPGSIFYKILGENAEMRLDYIYNVAGVDYVVKEFTMYTEDSWSGQFSDEVSVSVTDASKFLKEVKPQQMMIENKPVSEIVWRLCDSVGFNNYKVTSDTSSDYLIPVFWTTGEETIWEVLDDLSTTTQTAIYFDAYGTLQVKTNKNAFANLGAQWVISGKSTPIKLADIKDISSEGDRGNNQVIVKYKPSKWKVGSTGDPALSKVWEPETDTIVVRSSPIRKDVIASSGWFHIQQNQASNWPYASKVNIDGEVLEYEGKQFVYYTYTKTTNSNGIVSYSNPVRRLATVLSHDEYLEKHNSTPSEYQHRNYFYGAFKIKNRELWNSTMTDHKVDLFGWTFRGKENNTFKSISGVSHDKVNSLLTIAPAASRMKLATDCLFAYRGSNLDTPHKKYGTRMRIRKDSSRTNQVAGLGLYLTGDLDGYYIELRPTNSISTAQSAYTGEITVYSRKGTRMHNVGMGARMAVVAGQFYDVEASIGTSGGQHVITVWLNGVVVFKGATNATSKQANSGRAGMYTRAKSIADFEYMYGITRNINEPEDAFGFYDLVYGGLRSGYWQREFVYEWKTKNVRTKKRKSKKVGFRKNNYFFDEFGPYVHEIREFNVKFDPSPVQNSEIFSTNEWYSVVLDYNSTPFGAKFTVCNVSRKNAILHGEDSLIFNRSDATVNQVLNVLGRDLEVGEEEIITVKNQRAIEVNGLSEVELAGEWIQSKDTAVQLGKWISEHWSRGNDSLTAEIFGNPMLEIGDIVAVNHPDRFMNTTTHRYFVVGISNNWDNGLNTTLRLRRANNVPNSEVTVE